MAQGKSWTFTDARLAVAKKHFTAQGSVIALAIQFDIDQKTLLRKLREYKVDYKGMKSSGLLQLRKRMFQLIDAQITEKDQYDAGMKYLSRYEKLSDDEGHVEKVEVDVKAQILRTLGEDV